MYYHAPTQYFLLSSQHPEPLPSLLELGITSQQQADELERYLGVRFDDFTPEDCKTWFLQTDYLDQFSRTRAVSLAADNAGISIRTARQWQAENTLGFNNRLEIAVLRYTDVLEVMALQRAQEPDSPPSLLMMLLRAQMPEKYGSARRSATPRDDNPSNHHCDHGHQPNATSQYDRELLEEIFRDLQNLKQFAGLTEPDPTLVGAGFKPAHDPPAHSAASSPAPSPVVGEGWGEGPAPNTQNPEPILSPAGGETQRGGIPTPTEQAPVGADPKPAHDPPAHSAASLSCPLSRRGRGLG